MELSLSKSFYYRIKENDTFVSLAEKFNTTKEQIIRNNPNLNLYCGELVKIVVNDYITHIVKPTENLIKIADIYALSATKIKLDNNLSSEKLYIGQRLKICLEK